MRVLGITSKKNGATAAGATPSVSNALEQSIGYSLRRAQFSTYDAFGHAMRFFDVRPSQYAVLVLIRSNPGVTQSAVCSALGIQKTNFVTILDKLESRGVIKRQKVRSDRRLSALYLAHVGETFCSAHGNGARRDGGTSDRTTWR